MATHKDFGSAFNAMYRQIARAQRSLPAILANEGTKFFLSNFAMSGFTDIGFQPWAPRKQFTPDGKRIKKFNKKKLLVKTGRLRRAVNSSVREKSMNQIVWSIDPNEVPYAYVHNEGAIVYRKPHKRKVSTGSKKEGERAFKKHNVGATSFKMPRRHFMGNSAFLNARFKLRIKEVYTKSFNG